jgi:hypothetical protein
MGTENGNAGKAENGNAGKTVLSKKSINAIADQVEMRLKQDSAKPGSAPVVVTAEKEGHGNKKVFFWGALSGLAVAVAAPLVGRTARPAARGVIKGGLVAGRYMQRVASSVKEDIQDMTAEAKADLDVEKPESRASRASKQGKRPHNDEVQ